jgi:hypothetical protein
VNALDRSRSVRRVAATGNDLPDTLVQEGTKAERFALAHVKSLLFSWFMVTPVSSTELLLSSLITTPPLPVIRSSPTPPSISLPWRCP